MTNLYVVKDVPAKLYGPPMVARTDLAASRMFVRMVIEGKLSAADYELYLIGTYNEDTGEMLTHLPELVTPTYKRDASLEEVMP